MVGYPLVPSPLYQYQSYSVLTRATGSILCLCAGECNLSTSGTICGTSPWSTAIRSSWSSLPATRCGSSLLPLTFMDFARFGCLGVREYGGIRGALL
jgi:hypothetical protein